MVQSAYVQMNHHIKSAQNIMGTKQQTGFPCPSDRGNPDQLTTKQGERHVTKYINC
jgi:hypothetical protein